MEATRHAFYFMQIAPHKGQPAGIREAQLKTWQSG